MERYREIFRERRQVKGWSQYRMARELGVTQSTVNAIETGRRSPSIEVFFQICKLLDIKVYLDKEKIQ